MTLVGKLKLTNVAGGIADVAAFGNYAYLNAFGPECAGQPGAQGTGVHVVDCAREPGVILESTRVYRAPAKIVRVWNRPRGLRLRPVRERTIRWPAEKTVPFLEFGYPQPFPTCAKARAPR